MRAHKLKVTKKITTLWSCPFRRRRRSQISSSRHPFVKRIGVIYLLSTRISFLLTFCMVSHFSLFYSYHNHQNHEKRPPWRKNLPPHFSTATSLPNTMRICKRTYLIQGLRIFNAFRKKSKSNMFSVTHQSH